MSLYILLIEGENSNTDIIHRIERQFNIVRHNLNNNSSPVDTEEPALIIIDADISNLQIVKQLKEQLKDFITIPKLFLSHNLTSQSFTQATSLGADTILEYPTRSDCKERKKQKIDKITEYLKDQIKIKIQTFLQNVTTIEKKTLQTYSIVNDKINDNAIQGRPLPVKEISFCCDILITNLQDTCIVTWLDTVKSHHSYTHRHSLSVTALAIAFGMEYGLAKPDLNQLSLGALLHDIGKIKIPLNILDKPTKLSIEEENLIKKHPLYSAEILKQNQQFDQNIIEIAKSHHELLDGSGYPEGLSGSEISDSVRIMTIIDIFSALVDERSYKKGMLWSKAYEIMENMTGQLDKDFLKAFRPIAMRAPNKDGALAILHS